ncbi:hypothetical protein E2320_019495, partial [Naja naja]
MAGGKRKLGLFGAYEACPCPNFTLKTTWATEKAREAEHTTCSSPKGSRVSVSLLKALPNSALPLLFRSGPYRLTPRPHWSVGFPSSLATSPVRLLFRFCGRGRTSSSRHALNNPPLPPRGQLGPNQGFWLRSALAGDACSCTGPRPRFPFFSSLLRRTVWGKPFGRSEGEERGNAVREISVPDLSLRGRGREREREEERRGEKIKREGREKEKKEKEKEGGREGEREKGERERRKREKERKKGREGRGGKEGGRKEGMEGREGRKKGREGRKRERGRGKGERKKVGREKEREGGREGREEE